MSTSESIDLVDILERWELFRFGLLGVDGWASEGKGDVADDGRWEGSTLDGGDGGSGLCVVMPAAWNVALVGVAASSSAGASAAPGFGGCGGWGRGCCGASFEAGRLGGVIAMSLLAPSALGRLTERNEAISV